MFCCINSTIDNSSGYSDELNHGTIIIKELTQLVPTAEIINVKIFNNNESIDSNALKKGIDIAVANNVDVINLSIGYSEYSEDVSLSIKKAVEKGILIVAAAGNQGISSLMYPASYEGVISVVSRDINNKDSRMNNYSTEKKSFSAPGDHILIGEGKFVAGTSIACVFVSATVLFMKGSNTNLQVDELLEILVQTAIYPSDYSYGLIQCESALRRIKLLSEGGH